jgi:hypothetical protein
LLPAEGRTGRAPKPPKSYELGEAGLRWWRWAWKLPQAVKWDEGSLYFVARRAQLEDELDALSFDDELDLTDLLAGADEEAIDRVEFALQTLKRSATGSTTLMREMREIDNRLGLNPKALLDLRWTIEDSAAADAPAEGVASLDDYRDRVAS